MPPPPFPGQLGLKHEETSSSSEVLLQIKNLLDKTTVKSYNIQ